MIFLVIFVSGLVFLLDAFFVPSLFLSVKISFSLLALVLFLLARLIRPALFLALLTGLLADITASPFLFFGANLGWNFVVYILASSLLASFFAASKKSSVGIFSFLAALLYYSGQEMILFLQNYVLARGAEFHFFSLALRLAVSSLIFCLAVFAAQALWLWWRGLLRRWFLIR